MKQWMATISLMALSASGAAESEVSQRHYGINLREAHIEMPDGKRLAADLYEPTGGARDERFPVLLEYLPYRKRDDRGKRYPLFSYFVKRGYVVARVDIRGTGESEGTLVEYEYSEQEQSDGEAVIDWLSKQPFSNGNVGMFGISWGAFNSIHLAMRKPPALKAIIAIQGTDDIYQDDIHFIDGVLHFDSYEVRMDVENSVPGAPEYVVDERLFLDRFDTKPWMLVYKEQQRDGPFWNRASLNERYESIEVPTFVIGGWYDGYRDSVPRMLEHLSAPTKGIIGPWGHSWPNDGYPKPLIEWRHEAVRWFDHWLKGKDTGVLDEPSFAVFVRDWHGPGFDIEEVPGEWRLEDGWPLDRATPWTLLASPDNGLREEAPAPALHQLEYVPSSGVEAGGNVLWYGDFALDQAPTDEASLVYDTAPLVGDLEILGFPTALLSASADAPHANWYVRLADVAPDGSTTLITGAALNGTHRDSAERPELLEPGRTYPLEVEMHFTSWVFPKGHRIRLSVSNAQWPMFWPTPYPMTTTLQLGGERPSGLILPVVPAATRPRPAFLPPAEDDTLDSYRVVESGTVSSYAELSDVVRDAANGTATVIAENRTTTEYPWGIIEQRERIEHAASDRDPARTSVTTEYGLKVKLEERVLDFSGVLDLRSDLDNFYYVYTRRLHRGEELIRERVWRRTIPRDFQ